MSPLIAQASLGTRRYTVGPGFTPFNPTPGGIPGGGLPPPPGGGPGSGGFDWPSVEIPYTNLEGTICPPGTACSGPSWGRVCIGSCYVTGVGGEGGLGPDPGDPSQPPAQQPTPQPQGNGTKMCCPAGYHPNKSGYFLKSGTYVQPGSRCIKNRRKNPLNPRAASAALDRIVKGKKAAAFLGRVTVRKKKA